MVRYRKKPVVIDAIQVKREDSFRWLRSFCPSLEVSGVGTLVIPTLEGKMVVSEGDWIIKGVAGEFYPCKPDIFAETYEAV